MSMRAKQCLAKIWRHEKWNLSVSVASADVRSKAGSVVVDLFLFLLPFYMYERVLCLVFVLLCSTLRPFKFSIISLRKSELTA